MPTYQFSARDREGRQTAGLIAAQDVQEIRDTLRAKDLYLTTVKQNSRSQRSGPGLFARRKVGISEMVVLSRQLSTLVGAGLPIIEVLDAVAGQTENQTLVGVLREVRADVIGGSTLSGAMARHPKVFNEMFVSLVEAGEAGGVLEDTLETAALQYDSEAELREKVKAAFVYPCLVLVSSIAVVLFMLVSIVPTFARVYKQFNAELPAVTQLLVLTSHVIMTYGWIVVAVAVAVALLLRKYITTVQGRLQFDAVKLRLPLLGKLIRKIAVARFTRTLGGAVTAGVPILRSLVIAANTSGNMVIVDAINKVVQFVKDGSTLSVPLEASGQFPPMLTRMVAAGEKSGELDSMLKQAVKFYDRDIEYTVHRLTRLIEPIMVIVVGGVVLFVLLALYMPIFNLTQVIRKK